MPKYHYVPGRYESHMPSKKKIKMEVYEDKHGVTVVSRDGTEKTYIDKTIEEVKKLIERMANEGGFEVEWVKDVEDTGKMSKDTIRKKQPSFKVMNVISDMAKIASYLDEQGMYKEADYVDGLVNKIAEIDSGEYKMTPEYQEEVSGIQESEPMDYEEYKESGGEQYDVMLENKFDEGESKSVEFLEYFKGDWNELKEAVEENNVDKIMEIIAKEEANVEGRGFIQSIYDDIMNPKDRSESSYNDGLVEGIIKNINQFKD